MLHKLVTSRCLGVAHVTLFHDVDHQKPSSHVTAVHNGEALILTVIGIRRYARVNGSGQPQRREIPWYRFAKLTRAYYVSGVSGTAAACMQRSLRETLGVLMKTVFLSIAVHLPFL